ncbi:hypothetical protein Vafri_11079, partial [Volvox africanus]
KAFASSGLGPFLVSPTWPAYTKPSSTKSDAMASLILILLLALLVLPSKATVSFSVLRCAGGGSEAGTYRAWDSGSKTMEGRQGQTGTCAHFGWRGDVRAS